MNDAKHSTIETAANAAADEAARLLKRGDSLSFAEADATMREVGQHFVAVTARLELIQPRADLHWAGRERQSVTARGTPEEIAALDAEYRLLIGLADRLEAQRDTLSELRNRARIREAYERLPEMLESLAADVAAMEGAQKALAEAQAKTRRTFDATVNTRSLAALHGGPIPEPDRTVFDRMLTLDPERYQRHAEDLAGRIGIQLTMVESTRWAA